MVCMKQISPENAVGWCIRLFLMIALLIPLVPDTFISRVGIVGVAALLSGIPFLWAASVFLVGIYTMLAWMVAPLSWIALSIPAAALVPFCLLPRFWPVWMFIYGGAIIFPIGIQIGLHLFLKTDFDFYAIEAIFLNETEAVFSFMCAFWRQIGAVFLPILGVSGLIGCLLHGTVSGYSLKKASAWVCLIGAVMAVIFLLKQEVFQNEALFLPRRIINAFERMDEEKGYIQELRMSYQPFSRVSLDKPDVPRTIVIVIGESAAVSRFGVYGYQRNTTPFLSRIQNEVDLFRSVYAPHPNTLYSLRKVLTLAHGNNQALAETHGSVVHLFRQAGFKTFWISTQGIQDKYRSSLLVRVADAADQTFFLKTWSYDENVIPYFKNVLRDPAPMKAVFIHLIGSHSPYYKRYPASFQIWKGTEGEYDNSIRYTDFVLSRLMNQLRHHPEASLFLYFSDHGEEVRPGGCFCHTISLSRKMMFDIPFIMWRSKAFQTAFPETTPSKESRERLYNTQHFIHTAADLAGIRAAEIEREKSILFQAPFPRVIRAKGEAGTRRIILDDDGEAFEDIEERPQARFQIQEDKSVVLKWHNGKTETLKPISEDVYESAD